MEQTLGQKAVTTVLGAGLVFLALWWWSPSDRATIARCINGMVEASRGDGLYSQYRDQLEEISVADTGGHTTTRQMVNAV
ncbi:hypothetical protein [Tabrizicola sp.]|uniref:hypothetical protein n=1 Tax=Tabrizicola sp. TaxID=2005166 RepID=UPI0035AFE06A